jgi:hypothetical protein
MSDVSQGLGWWQASDGKWYAPQPQPGQQPPFIVQKKGGFGKGCLLSLAIVVGLVVILIIVLVIVASSSSKSTVPGIPNIPGLPAPGQGSTSHPATADVAMTACSTDTTLNLPTASLTITNHSSQPSNYIVDVNFTSGGTIVAQGIAVENDVAAGQQAHTDATGDMQVTGAVTCQVASVTRVAA